MNVHGPAKAWYLSNLLCWKGVDLAHQEGLVMSEMDRTPAGEDSRVVALDWSRARDPSLGLSTKQMQVAHVGVEMIPSQIK